METYGTDALRFTLASMASPGRDIRLAEERIEGYRNFANKLWNAARFILMNLDGPREAAAPGARSFPDRWILSRLNQAIRAVTAALEEYRFDQAAGALYRFIWHEYCDWYLELIKPALQDQESEEASRIRQTLVDSFETVQRLAHPFMPFITEEIWQALPHEDESVMIRPFPEPAPDWDAKDIEERFHLLEEFVTTVRTGRALLAYPPGKRLSLFGASDDEACRTDLGRLHAHLEHLGRGTVELLPVTQWPQGRVLRLVVGGLTVGVVVEGEVDLQKALDRIKKDRAAGAKEAARIEGKLANADFTAKAPPEVVAEHRERLRTLREEEALLASSEEQLRAIIATRTA
jgi:valyl-tRNA synthetase